MPSHSRNKVTHQSSDSKALLLAWGLVVFFILGLGSVSVWVGMQLGQKRDVSSAVTRALDWAAGAVNAGLEWAAPNPDLSQPPAEEPSPVQPKLAAVPAPESPVSHAAQLEREKSALPKSYSSGLFTVQVGSFFSAEPAQALVKFLKGRGFPHAFVSQSLLPGKPTPWFRVWLGYYNDFNSAREVGAFLEAKETVERAFVRRSDSLSDSP